MNDGTVNTDIIECVAGLCKNKVEHLPGLVEVAHQRAPLSSVRVQLGLQGGQREDSIAASWPIVKYNLKRKCPTTDPAGIESPAHSYG
ncbi:MAG: hypothetical protein IMZ71_00655 [Chloroflexi bacterium]|nr:hypothetical protein [Chloroflexota bacterium]